LTLHREWGRLHYYYPGANHGTGIFDKLAVCFLIYSLSPNFDTIT
jgi:hypothetical protein